MKCNHRPFIANPSFRVFRQDAMRCLIAILLLYSSANQALAETLIQNLLSEKASFRAQDLARKIFRDHDMNILDFLDTLQDAGFTCAVAIVGPADNRFKTYKCNYFICNSFFRIGWKATHIEFSPYSIIRNKSFHGDEQITVGVVNYAYIFPCGSDAELEAREKALFGKMYKLIGEDNK